MRTVVGLFENRAQAQRAVEYLRNWGFPTTDISVAMRQALPDSEALEHIGGEDAGGAGGSTTGAVIGGALGGLAGLLVGIGALSIPGVGRVVAAGPLGTAIATTLFGAGIGAAAGGITGALVDAGLPLQEARLYSTGVEHGGVLVNILVPDYQEQLAQSIMNANGAQDVRYLLRELSTDPDYRYGASSDYHRPYVGGVVGSANPPPTRGRPYGSERGGSDAGADVGGDSPIDKNTDTTGTMSPEDPDAHIPADSTVKRIASAEFPPRVDAGTDNILSYAIARYAVFGNSDESAAELVPPKDVTELAIRVTVHTTDFQVLDPQTRKSNNSHLLTVSFVDDTEVLGEFLLRSKPNSAHKDTTIRLRFTHNGLPLLGQISLPTTIAAQSPSVPNRSALESTAMADASIKDTDRALPPGVTGAGRSPAMSRAGRDAISHAPEFQPSSLVENTPSAVATLAIQPDMEARAPDFVFYVSSTGNGNFNIEVGRNRRPRPFPVRNMGSFPTNGEAWKYARTILEQFRMSREEPTFEERRLRVEGIGKDLWRQLPPLFQAYYWKELHSLVDKGASIAIYSEEPYIPWELIMPQDEDGKTDPMLGVAFSVARWNQRFSYKDSLTVSGFGVIAPDYPVNKLIYTAQEATELANIYRAKVLQSNKPAVLALLGSRGFQLIHFAGHGQFNPDPQENANSEIKLIDGDLIPSDVENATIGYSDRPLIFLNACEVGRTGWKLTQIGGWADKFCGKDFTGFVGPYWAVNDQVAKKASLIFYDELKKGNTIGEAMRIVRTQFTQDKEFPSHPTWLAYSVYCQPNVKVYFP